MLKYFNNQYLKIFKNIRYNFVKLLKQNFKFLPPIVLVMGFHFDAPRLKLPIKVSNKKSNILNFNRKLIARQ